MALFKKKTTKANSWLSKAWNSVKESPIVKAVVITALALTAIVALPVVALALPVIAAVGAISKAADKGGTKTPDTPKDQKPSKVPGSAPSTPRKPTDPEADSDPKEPIENPDSKDSIRDDINDALDDIEDDGKDKEIEIEADISDFEGNPEDISSSVYDGFLDFYEDKGYSKDEYGEPDIEIKAEVDKKPLGFLDKLSFMDSDIIGNGLAGNGGGSWSLNNKRKYSAAGFAGYILRYSVLPENQTVYYTERERKILDDATSNLIEGGEPALKIELQTAGLQEMIKRHGDVVYYDLARAANQSHLNALVKQNTESPEYLKGSTIEGDFPLAIKTIAKEIKIHNDLIKIIPIKSIKEHLEVVNINQKDIVPNNLEELAQYLAFGYGMSENKDNREKLKEMYDKDDE